MGNDDAPSIGDRLEQIEGRMLTAVEIRSSTFRRIMRNILRELRAEILAQLNNPASALASNRLADLMYVKAELERQMNQMGLKALSERFVASFDALKQGPAEAVRAVGKAERLAPLDEFVLHKVKQTSLEWLDELGRRAVNEIAQGLAENAVLGGNKRNMVKRVEQALTKYESHATTYADTVIVTYDREVQWQTFRNAGINQLKYTGPKDIKNRPFCKQHVGKTYTREEIAKLDNGTTLMPVSRFGGGWNCRHIFMPDPEEL